MDDQSSSEIGRVPVSGTAPPPAPSFVTFHFTDSVKKGFTRRKIQYIDGASKDPRSQNTRKPNVLAAPLHFCSLPLRSSPRTPTPTVRSCSPRGCSCSCSLPPPRPPPRTPSPLLPSLCSPPPLAHVRSHTLLLRSCLASNLSLCASCVACCFVQCVSRDRSTSSFVIQ